MPISKNTVDGDAIPKNFLQIMKSTSLTKRSTSQSIIGVNIYVLNVYPISTPSIAPCHASLIPPRKATPIGAQSISLTMTSNPLNDSLITSATTSARVSTTPDQSALATATVMVSTKFCILVGISRLVQITENKSLIAVPHPSVSPVSIKF